jgi:hypothetical protein
MQLKEKTTETNTLTYNPLNNSILKALTYVYRLILSPKITALFESSNRGLQMSSLLFQRIGARNERNRMTDKD